MKQKLTPLPPSLTLAKKLWVSYSRVVCTAVFLKLKNELIFDAIRA